MKKSNPYRRRLIVVLSFLVAALVCFGVVLFNYQIVNGDEYRALSVAGTAKREVVETSRGIITDRNGKVLVSNRLAYTLKFSDSDFGKDQAACNDAVWRLIELCRAEGVEWIDPLPLTAEAPYTLSTESPGKTFISWLKNNKLAYTGESTVTLTASSDEVMAALRKVYNIADGYTDQQARLIAGVRYGAKISGGYVFAEDVPVRVISQVVDGHYAGVSTGTSSQRVYNTTYAAHILGRVSRIFAEDWDNYKDKGYSMDALVGKGGVEEAFESYLHGTNGVKLVTTDKNGKVTGELYAKEPQPGNTVALTIDLDLQKVTEDSLAEKIGSMEQRDGLTRGGAAAVVSVGTGEVLALASYPTYDLSQWDEMYDTWNKDTVGRPMFNRATDGTYAPGSTFKLCSAVAALESGIVTPSTTIVDRGIYTYYTFPQPKCWIYNSYGGTHGAVNVSQAITVSCNYFFYEVGRLMGIKTLDSYATQFGLGQHTGIEIGDSAGVLASPEYAEKIGETWTDGQTITAAIGQSYNLFTPLQLANYVATLVSGGDHYEAHLLKSAKSFDNSSVVYAYNKAPINHVDMADSTLEAVKKGARGLATGSLSYVFRNCVVDVGCKTGTAETSQKLTNGCFVAFAPYDDPQIAVCVVAEQGGGGANLAPVALDIINAYFSSASTTETIEGENTMLP
ncbi:MAG: penicillin-binding protein A [Clostridiales bacterium]|nr:penicillin-binding protein A [Clostridiales bacterium]